MAAIAFAECSERGLAVSVQGYSDIDSSYTTISFSFPFSDILGRVELDAVDREEGAAWVVTGGAKRDEEAIGCLVVGGPVLIVDELAVGFEDEDVAVKVDLLLDA